MAALLSFSCDLGACRCTTRTQCVARYRSNRCQRPWLASFLAKMGIQFHCSRRIVFRFRKHIRRLPVFGTKYLN